MFSDFLGKFKQNKQLETLHGLTRISVDLIHQHWIFRSNLKGFMPLTNWKRSEKHWWRNWPFPALSFVKEDAEPPSWEFRLVSFLPISICAASLRALLSLTSTLLDDVELASLNAVLVSWIKPNHYHTRTEETQPPLCEKLSAGILIYSEKRTIFPQRNCKLRGIDNGHNVQGQISEHIFKVKWGHCVYFPSMFFAGEYHSHLSWSIFSHVTS